MDADQAMAKYILVMRSAFVSHLVETGRKAGLLSKSDRALRSTRRQSLHSHTSGGCRRRLLACHRP